MTSTAVLITQIIAELKLFQPIQLIHFDEMWSQYTGIDLTDQRGVETWYNSHVLIINQSHHEIKGENQSCPDWDVHPPIMNKKYCETVIPNIYWQ